MREWIVEIGDGNPHIKRMKELVRCKDCKHWFEGHGGSLQLLGKCDYTERVTPKFQFCCYGERREVTG